MLCIELRNEGVHMRGRVLAGTDVSIAICTLEELQCFEDLRCQLVAQFGPGETSAGEGAFGGRGRPLDRKVITSDEPKRRMNRAMLVGGNKCELMSISRILSTYAPIVQNIIHLLDRCRQVALQLISRLCHHQFVLLK